IATTLCFGTRLDLISAALSVFLSLYFFEPVGSPTLRYTSDLDKIVLYAVIAFGCVVSFAFAEVRTEQIEARRALVESETRFRAAFENAAVAEARLAERNAQFDIAGKIARIGSFMYDDGTKTLQLSPGCAAIYGLPEGTLEIAREDWRARVHPDD